MSNKTANASDKMNSDAINAANNIFNAHEANNFEEVHRLWSEVMRTEDMDFIVKTHSKTRGDISIKHAIVNAVRRSAPMNMKVPDRGSEDPAQVLSAIRESQEQMLAGLLTREEFLTRVEEFLGPTDTELESRGIMKTVTWVPKPLNKEEDINVQ